jgi:hypothetical protein
MQLAVAVCACPAACRDLVEERWRRNVFDDLRGVGVSLDDLEAVEHLPD